MENIYKCNCGEPIRFIIVKNGLNKNREYFKCPKCKKFYWNDSNNYNAERFKNGSCYRCGNYGCEVTDCDNDFDWFGNLIPPIKDDDI